MARRNLKPLRLTDDDLDALAEITEQDIIRAHQTAVRALDPRYKNLLLTTADDSELPDEESE